MKQKFPALDAVRFLTAFCVVLYHQCYWNNGRLAAPGTAYAMWSFGWVGVEVFFTISGFVIAFSAAGTTAPKFLLSRATRLFPGIWICATLTLLATLWLSNQPDLYTRYWHTMFFRLWGNHIDIVYWTLTVEIAFYCVVLALVRFGNFKLLLRTLLVIGMISSAFDIVLACSRFSAHGTVIDSVVKFSQMQTSRLLLFRHGCFFALGALLWSRLTAYRPQFFGGLFAMLLVGTAAEVFAVASDNMSRYPMQHLSAFTAPEAWLIGLTLIVVSSLPAVSDRLGGTRTVRTLRNVGLLTFPLYLVHNNLGLLVQERLSAFTQSREAGTLLCVCFCIALAGIVSTWLEPPLARVLKDSLVRLSTFPGFGRAATRVPLESFAEESLKT